MNTPPIQSIYNAQANEQQEEIQRGFITRVYGWMALGLIVTAAIAFLTISSPSLMTAIVTNRILFFGLLIGELLLVAVISGAASRLSPVVAGLLFLGYAGLNGVTLSILILLYTASSIAITFGVTACTFAIMSLFGLTTHRDLTKMGSLLIMGLIGVIIASVVNLFLNLSAIYWITTYLGVLIFIGLVAYDTQKLKRMSLTLGGDGQLTQKASILGALSLYLDFINLFLLLLRILGGRRR
ncbi:MAG: Bax inhibitor-1/YccA family protein [Anaerolineaceae bacterium]|nr:Bax inhibitor-1/YccA family protein [Anaerolineaceae bacterium]